ncbi:hypothetical protein [Bacillus sp. COPE52]|uniref:hypothetical protein n=1 Tax=Bacillus sp. COPE52 TaxID=2233998 RepID=UPI000E1011EF|nr:hypothetical protein [Bacillus sp. COPE52]AXK19136.1 hypothetical protein DPQ31_16125 [Bacillus sp. COPE52]
METKELRVIATVHLKTGKAVDVHNVVGEIPVIVEPKEFLKTIAEQMEDVDFTGINGLNEDETKYIEIPKESIDYITFSVEENQA